MPYKDPLLTAAASSKTKAEGTIPSIQVQCRFLESQVDLLSNPLEQMQEQQQEEGDAVKMTPLEKAWHKLPYCFVYFVTCQTTDDYRTKVKPGIQVFLSQLEDLYKQRTDDDKDKEVSAPSYLLVYCPQRDTGSAPILIGDDPNNPTAAGGASSSQRPAVRLANRIRQRMAASSSTTTSPGDGSTPTTPQPDSTDNLSMTDSTTSLSSSTPPTTAASMEGFSPADVLTKMEKEIARRLTTDFGTAAGGNVAVMTTLANGHYFENFGNSSMKTGLDELERLEWTFLLKEWSKSIQHGFEMTCKSLEKVVKTLLQRQESGDNDSRNDDYTDIVLIKESLALTYEQMNLPAQALLQYHELRALLPDLPSTLAQYKQSMHQDHQSDELAGIDNAGSRSEATLRSTSRTLVTDWLAAVSRSDWRNGHDPIVFRKELKSGFAKFKQSGSLDRKYYSLAPFIETYLWERETSILFLTGDAVEVLQRTLTFCVSLVEYQKKILQQANNAGGDDEENAKTSAILMQLEAWSFCFCWDLKRASQAYLQDLSAQKKNALSAELFGKHLCDVVSYSRLRLLALAKLKLPSLVSDPKFAFMGKRGQRRPIPSDITSGWDPWDPSKTTTSKPYTPGGDLDSESFLEMALGASSREDFMKRYIDVARVLASLSLFAGRHRSAARLSLELVGLYLERGQIEQATDSLKSMAKLYGRENWKGCQFLLHFRLAGLKRQLVLPKDYLAAIVQCFSRRNNNAGSLIPEKALQVLYEDFQAVMAVLSQESSASSSPGAVATFTNSPVFETVLKHTSDPQQRKLPNRRLVRQVYTVGDTSRISLSLTSHLAQEIEGVTVSAILIPYKSYVAAIEDGKSISQVNTSSQVVTIPEGVILKPGVNDLEIAWTAAVAGQFVLTQLSLAYKAATFFYTYERMKDPFRIDVIPGEPTQLMEVKPLFFVPGHEQELEINFHSGKDEIVKGDLNLVCTPGLVLCPASSDKGDGTWSSACKVSLDACPPETDQVLKFWVKSEKNSNEENDTGVAPSVHAKITTSYCLATKGVENVVKKEVKGDDVFSTQFPYEMEAVIPSLADQALSIDNMSFNTYAAGRSILSISAKCHVPAPFALKGWSLDAPSTLQLVENKEMHKGLKDIMLLKGDIATFCFDCAHNTTPDKSLSETALIAELEDEHKTRFTERLPLRLKKTSFATNLPEKIHSLSLNASLVPITNRGVGVPMLLKFDMDATPVTAWKGEIHFAVDTDNEGWLLCGNTRGVVSLDSARKWALEMNAIPTNPGAFNHLPTVEFTFSSGENEKPYQLVLPMAQESTSENFSHETTHLTHSSIAFSTSTRLSL